jgi:hypothetical protein
MQAYLLSAFPGTPTTLIWLRESAEQDPFGRHRLVDDADQADVILFAENHAHGDPYCLSIRHHPVYRRFPKKCFVYHDDDNAVAVLRGIYPSIRKRDYLVDRCRSAGYIARIAQNDSIRYDPAPRTRKYLYSFLGEANSPVRLALFARAHPEGLIRDTTGDDDNVLTSNFLATLSRSKVSGLSWASGAALPLSPSLRVSRERISLSCCAIWPSVSPHHHSGAIFPLHRRDAVGRWHVREGERRGCILSVL